MRGRFDQFAVSRDAGVGADGANDGVTRRKDIVGALDDVAEGKTHVDVAPPEQPGRMGVAIERPRLDLKVVGDVVDGLPMHEFLLDGVALGMIADGAATFVMIAREVTVLSKTLPLRSELMSLLPSEFSSIPFDNIRC